MNRVTGEGIRQVPLGRWRMEGWIGERIDALSEARLTSEAAWKKLYPETEQAFRLREDDTSHPGRGVWRGEFWGKYVLSAIDACRYYRSETMKQTIKKAVAGLLSTQDENGYIGTYSDSGYFGSRTWNIWCRKYTLWGLIEAWKLLQDDSIIEAACRFTDHLISEVGPDGAKLIETGQFYGLPSTSILKPITMLYEATNQERYLDFARYIVAQWSEHPTGIPDLLGMGVNGKPIHSWFPKAEEWAKSYEFVSCVEGLLALYRISGAEDYLLAAENIHAAIVEWERSPVGSISFNDKFVGSRYLINTVAEICDAVYWNRLSLELFMLTGKSQYLDEFERTFYNALLCGMSPDGSWGLRRLRCSHEHIPAHHHFLKHHQCCVDNMPRGLFQAAQSAIFTELQGIRIALFNPGSGTVQLPSGGLAGISIRGDFLEDEQIQICLQLDRPEQFRLLVRQPNWSGPLKLIVNGDSQPGHMEEGWLVFERIWNTSDRIVVIFDMNINMEYFDSTRIDHEDPLASRHRGQWASMGVISEDDMKHEQKVRLGLEDALPQQAAVMFFWGPLALVHDIRLGGDPLMPIGKQVEPVGGRPGMIKEPPQGIWKAFELELQSGERLRLCDFASAGNTWDRDSEFSAWKLIE